MTAENKLVNISGTLFGQGDQTVSMTLLVAQSGAIYIPVQCDDTGKILVV